MSLVFRAVYAAIVVAWLRRTWQRVAPEDIPIYYRRGGVDWYWIYVNGGYVAQTGDKGKAFEFVHNLYRILGPGMHYEIREQDEPDIGEDMAVFDADMAYQVTVLIDSLGLEGPDAYA